MATGSTLYRINMDLSDVDRGVYEALDLRVACHPSESEERLVTRVLAYGLLYEEGLEFGKGLSTDEPGLWKRDLTGQIEHWIDIGTPSADRVHLASKKAGKVSIVCHHSEEALKREVSRRKVHRAEQVQVLLLEPALIKSLAEVLDRTSQWSLVRTDGDLNISVGEHNFTGTLRNISLPQ